MAVTEQLQNEIMEDIENLDLDTINSIISSLKEEYTSLKEELVKETMNGSKIDTDRIVELTKEIKQVMTSIKTLEEAIYNKKESPDAKREEYKNRYKKNLTKEVIKNLNNPELNFTRIQRELELLRLADKTPLLIGEKGIGKTATVRDYAKKIGADFITIELSQIDPVEFMGYMIPEEAVGNSETQKGTIDYDKVRKQLEKLEGKKVDKILVHRHTMPSWIAKILQNAEEGKPTVLFLDEINRGSRDVMNAVMNLIYEKKFGPEEIKLPPNVFIVAAANPDDGEYSVLSFDKAQRDRVVEINFEMSYAEWRNKVAPKLGIHDSIIRFLDEHEEYFNYTDPETDVNISARNWEQVSDKIKAYESIAKYVNINMRREMEELLRGILKSEKVADEYFAFYNTHNKLTYKDLKRIINQEIETQYKYIKNNEGTENLDKKVYDLVKSRIKTLLKQYEDADTTSQDVLNEYVEGAIKDYVEAVKDVMSNAPDKPSMKDKELLPIALIIDIAGSSYIKTLEANLKTAYDSAQKNEILVNDMIYLSEKFGCNLLDTLLEYKLQAFSDNNMENVLEAFGLYDEDLGFGDEEDEKKGKEGKVNGDTREP